MKKVWRLLSVGAPQQIPCSGSQVLKAADVEKLLHKFGC